MLEKEIKVKYFKSWLQFKEVARLREFRSNYIVCFRCNHFLFYKVPKEKDSKINMMDNDANVEVLTGTTFRQS